MGGTKFDIDSNETNDGIKHISETYTDPDDSQEKYITHVVDKAVRDKIGNIEDKLQEILDNGVPQSGSIVAPITVFSGSISGEDYYLTGSSGIDTLEYTKYRLYGYSPASEGDYPRRITELPIIDPENTSLWVEKVIIEDSIRKFYTGIEEISTDKMRIKIENLDTEAHEISVFLQLIK